MSGSLKDLVRAVVPRELRNWIRSPLKSAEWLWDSALFTFGTVRSIELLPNVDLLCHPNAYKVYRRAQIEDVEQREEFCSFVSHCQSGMLLFDVGAHFGVFTLTAAKLGGNAVAVDPSPISARMMAYQVGLNKCAGKVRIVQAAVSDTNGVIGMLGSGVFTPGYFKVAKGRPRSELTQIPTMTIDEMSLQFGTPTHLKIDVEGYEASVLRGARQTLKKSAPLLFLELHNDMVRSASGDPLSSLTELDQLGYETYSPSGELIGKAAILSEPIIRILARRPHHSVANG